LTSSTQGQHGTKYGAAYSPSKWAVNAVIPGLIDTPLTRHQERYAQVLEVGGRTPTGSATDEEEARKILITKKPLGVPWIEPGNVAPVVVFLASDAARMVSGGTYDVTAGDKTIQRDCSARRFSGNRCQTAKTIRFGTSTAPSPHHAYFQRTDQVAE